MDISNLISIGLSIGGALVAIIVFLIKFGGKITKAEAALAEVEALKAEITQLKNTQNKTATTEEIDKKAVTAAGALDERLRSLKAELENRVTSLNNTFSSTISQWRDLEEKITELLQSSSVSETEIAHIEKRVETIERILGELRERVARTEGQKRS